MVFTHPVISKSSSPFNSHSVTVTRADQPRQQSPHFCKFSLFYFFFLFFFLLLLLLLLLIIIRSGRLDEIKWSVWMAKSQRSFCVSYSRTEAGLCIYHLFVWSNWNFLHNSQWITLLTQSCLLLYFFRVNLLYSFIMWLVVSSLSPHSLDLQFFLYD